jgi:hypothetical protein
MSNRENCNINVTRTVDPVFRKPLKFVERLTNIITSSLFGFNEAGRTFQDLNSVDIENSAFDDLSKIEANDHQFGKRVDLRETNMSLFNINFENFSFLRLLSKENSITQGVHLDFMTESKFI